MAIKRLLRTQFVPAALEAVWDFFSDAKNLATITPSYLNFKVTSGDLPTQIYPGQVITYTVSPLLGIPLFWMTEITAVEPGRMFVDEQRRGPYSLWHHQHHFKQVPGGVEMTDIVHYELPLGPLGSVAHALFVKRQLDEIFKFRTKVIGERFGTGSRIAGTNF